MPIMYRKLLPHESPLYRTIRLTCLQRSPGNFGSTFEEESAKSKLKFESLIEASLPNHFVIGAFDEAALIGIAGFDRMDRQRTYHRGNVEQVYIDDNYRGQNIGARLMRTLIEEAFALEGMEQLHLGVVTGNIAAIHLYEKLGFKTFGIHPHYFKVNNQYIDQQLMQLLKSDYFAAKE